MQAKTAGALFACPLPDCSFEQEFQTASLPSFDKCLMVFASGAQADVLSVQTFMSKTGQQDLESIKDLHRRWLSLELDGRGAEVVELCTDDVRWLPCDAPPMIGKDEIAQYLAAHQVKVVAIDITDLSVHGSGSFAYLTSNYRTQYVTATHSEPHESKGTHLWILRKENDEWRVAVVAWSAW
jgi:ketosteroid isomerase-like protein